MAHIILIEDDEEIINILSTHLPKYGLEVTGFTDPTVALNSLKIDKYDLMLLDLTLPHIDGLDVCRIVTKEYNLPIIITSARSDIMDQVIGLELGADDYIPKPFDLREVVARIQSVLRRMQNVMPDQQSEFKCESQKMLIYHHDQPLDLTLAEYEVLGLFLQKKQIVITREFIANNVDAIGWESSDKSIDVIVGRIRKKLGDDPRHPNYIKSIRGVGYKFIG